MTQVIDFKYKNIRTLSILSDFTITMDGNRPTAPNHPQSYPQAPAGGLMLAAAPGYQYDVRPFWAEHFRDCNP